LVEEQITLNRKKAATALLERVETLEKKVDNLANHVANHVASPATLLVGWAEISRYCRKSARSLSRYSRNYAFPAVRLGAHVVSSPAFIDWWLARRKISALEKRKRLAEAALSDSELKARVDQLDAKLKR
jgi:hypothetical protein